MNSLERADETGPPPVNSCTLLTIWQSINNIFNRYDLISLLSGSNPQKLNPNPLRACLLQPSNPLNPRFLGFSLHRILRDLARCFIGGNFAGDLQTNMPWVISCILLLSKRSSIYNGARILPIQASQIECLLCLWDIPKSYSKNSLAI